MRNLILSLFVSLLLTSTGVGSARAAIFAETTIAGVYTEWDATGIGGHGTVLVLASAVRTGCGNTTIEVVIDSLNKNYKVLSTLALVAMLLDRAVTVVYEPYSCQNGHARVQTLVLM